MGQIYISEILKFIKQEGLDYQYIGLENISITGFSSLNKYKEGTITWVKKKPTYEQLEQTKKMKLIVTQRGLDLEGTNVIYADESKKVFFKILKFFFKQDNIKPQLGHGTYIGSKVKLGENVKIGCNCLLDGTIEIGDNTEIWHNVIITNKASIGKNCVIQHNVIMGTDGLGYTEDKDCNKMLIESFGGVQIGNNAMIFSNVVVERGTIDDTIVGNNTILGVGCVVGHNSRVGDGTVLITGTTAYGSVNIGENAYVSTCIIKNGTEVGDNAFINMGSVVVRDVEIGQTVMGNPARPLPPNKIN